MVSALFSPGVPQMELFETDESDMVLKHDLIVPLPKFDSRGLRVRSY